jgi:hypothetical protein
VSARPRRDIVNDRGSSSHEAFARWRTSHKPDLAVLLTDALYTWHSGQRYGHALPQLAFEGFFAKELGNRDKHQPPRLPGAFSGIDAFQVLVICDALPGFLSLSNIGSADLIGHGVMLTKSPS